VYVHIKGEGDDLAVAVRRRSLGGGDVGEDDELGLRWSKVGRRHQPHGGRRMGTGIDLRRQPEAMTRGGSRARTPSVAWTTMASTAG
jgi:hypothetical protein